MPQGTLEVVLVDAKGLDNNDFLAKISPYAVLTVNNQEKKSAVLSGKGSNPEWNESFKFKLSDNDEAKELQLTIMDKDNFSADDFVGEATIPLLPAFVNGTVSPTTYNIVNKNKEFRGGIKLGLTFTPESGYLPGRSEHGEEGSGGRKHSSDVEEVQGGWKQSSQGEERLGGRNEASYEEGRHGGRNEPSYGEERPPHNEERPSYGQERPSYGEDKPHSRSDRPPHGEDRPPFGGDRVIDHLMAKIGRLSGVIGHLMGKIGHLSGAIGHLMGKIGRLLGAIDHLMGKIGHILEIGHLLGMRGHLLGRRGRLSGREDMVEGMIRLPGRRDMVNGDGRCSVRQCLRIL